MFLAKLAHFYGWTHQEINSIPYSVASKYYESITIIDAQKVLVDLNIADYPRMVGNSRTSFYRDIRKKAYPPNLQKEMSFEEFTRMMNGGRENSTSG